MAKQRLDAETKVLFKKMKEIVDKEVQHYKSDLDIDKEVIEKSRMNEFFVWSVYDCGTRIMPLDKMRPVEYEIGKTDGWVPNKAFYLIQKGHSEMKEITRENAISLIQDSNKNCFERMRPGETVILENGEDGAKYDTYMVKQPNGSLLQVEKSKTTNMCMPQWFIQKEEAVAYVEKMQLDNRYLGASVGSPFTQDELQKLANFQNIEKKPPKTRAKSQKSKDSNELSL